MRREPERETRMEGKLGGKSLLDMPHKSSFVYPKIKSAVIPRAVSRNFFCLLWLKGKAFIPIVFHSQNRTMEVLVLLITSHHGSILCYKRKYKAEEGKHFDPFGR